MLDKTLKLLGFLVRTANTFLVIKGLLNLKDYLDDPRLSTEERLKRLQRRQDLVEKMDNSFFVSSPKGTSSTSTDNSVNIEKVEVTIPEGVEDTNTFLSDIMSHVNKARELRGLSKYESAPSR